MFHDYLILGGAGLVGLQVCRQIANQLSPKRVVLASLLKDQAVEACQVLEDEFGDTIAFVPTWGNLFVPTEMADLHRSEVLANKGLRRKLLRWLYGDFDEACRTNHLVNLIRQHRPEVIVDCVNTATGLSYQNVFEGAHQVLEWLDEDGFNNDGLGDLEGFLLSQSVPQLIRHVRFLHRATTDYDTSIYVKVGTTGTGGMGLNIPYTHSEDKPSKVLLAKTEAAFGHTGLLFLLARTPHAPIVKEVKPAAMIGYRAVRTVPVTDKHGNGQLFQPKCISVAGTLALAEPSKEYESLGELKVTVVDTGENGLFTRGEFSAITSLGQMEYITPEEIAETVVLEIRGANSGNDVVSALDSSVLNPSYKAGLVRSAALSDLSFEEGHAALPSIALGRLGPPELSKLLFEAHLLQDCYKTLNDVRGSKQNPRKPREISDKLMDHLFKSPVRHIAPSIGIPILLADGKKLLRGPQINVPELSGRQTAVSLDNQDLVNKWAEKGWIDLRPINMDRWLQRVTKMIDSRMELRDAGSAAASTQSYLPTGLEIGEVVAWIFNNEMDGYRIK
ncbi:MAG: hypothetical protein HN348_05985 [Proteobacteria bacterium]|nr:hypothetical protein [Pseudomonadota bacterium]